MKNTFLLLCLFFAAACATTETPSTPDDYIAVIDSYSDGEVEYVGAYNNFKYRATILNNTVQNTLIDRKAALYLWDDLKKQQELANLQADNGTTTKVFLSFYTPDRRDDNLSSPKTIWALYLETPQGRYTGTVKRVRVSPTELMTLYPYHNRFATAYMVEFPVALSGAESQEAKMTVTGPLGNKTIQFPAKK
jgi:hypothetical protein